MITRSFKAWVTRVDKPQFPLRQNEIDIVMTAFELKAICKAKTKFLEIFLKVFGIFKSLR